MQVLSILALATAALANSPAYNTQYVQSVNGVCVVQPGFMFNTGAALDQAATFIWTAAVAPSTTPTCHTGDAVISGARCASGYVASIPATFPSGTVAATTTAGAFAAAVLTPTTLAQPNNYDFATNAFNCLPVACNYTCTGTGCAAASGSIDVGTSSSTVCKSPYFQVAPTTCTSANTNDTIAVTCTNDTTTITSVAQWNTIANETDVVAHSTPAGVCRCTVGSALGLTCPNTGSVTAERAACSGCLTGCTVGQTRQAQGTTAGSCPWATTLDQAKTCFKNLACAGFISKSDTCVYGAAPGLTASCPSCDKSKKSLLGLLGLLGLIPLLLCLFLLCCLPLCCRRSKKGAPQHIGTFEQPAACAMEVPVQHATMHTTTHYGAPHGGFVGAPVVGPTVF